MAYAVLLLLLVAALAALARDPVLAGAALLLVAVALARQPKASDLVQAYAGRTGMFFLLLYLMVPIVTLKVTFASLPRLLLSSTGLAALTAGLLVSWIGGRGVAMLGHRAELLPGLLVGTLLAVVFLRGLPAGLIIAAGLLSVLRVVS